MGFDFSSKERRELGYQLIDRIDQYFSSLQNRAIQPPAEARHTQRVALPLPELGADAAQVLNELCDEMIDRGFHIPSANYFGLMNPTPTYMAVLAEALVAALNPQLASLSRSQFASQLEAETIGWIAALFGWTKRGSTTQNLGSTAEASLAPSSTSLAASPLCDGTFTSGGNEANFTALALAVAARFPQAIEDGVAAIGARPVLYASAESHHSLEKSVGLLGLGRKALRRIAVNDRLQLDPTQLIQQIEADLAAGLTPLCLIATAGTTSSGAIDDLELMASIARRFGLWLHVDGAYGAALALSERHRHLLRGIEQADSLTIDPHKWLAMPYAAGMILTRHPNLLEHVFAVAPPYLSAATTGVSDNFKIGAQWSRRMNSLKLWLTLRVHGRQAYAQMIDRQMELADQMRVWFEQSSQFSLATPSQLPILNFRLRDVDDDAREEAHVRFLEELTRDGRYWISRTHVRGQSVLRMMIISYLSDEPQLRGLQQALLAAAQRLPASSRAFASR